jgi:phospholipid/cholesterol/gamma-HCH transport system substrate-binding protein
MRRLYVAIVVALVIGGGIFLLASGRSGDPSGYRVDVVFDHARGLIPGQLVQVAGGRVGKIEDVSVTDDFKARISMVVDERFAPFHEDATCTIRPQGLIAENYVQCDPGRPDEPELEGDPPTVPVEQTSQPVNLTDLFEVWNVPTRDRLAVLLSELGTSVAARGEDLNTLLRRVNPALARAREVIALLEDQKDDLLGAIDASDAALAKLVDHRDDARRLVRSAADVLTVTGRRAGELAETTQRLPQMLREAQPALASLDAVAERGIPLLAALNRSAPTALELTTEAPRLARAARPTLAALAPVLRHGAGVVKRAVPVSRALKVYARQSLPSARLTGRLLPNLSERGFPDSLMRFFFYAALATSRFDGTSHIIPAHIDLTSCGQYAQTPEPGCRPAFESETTARALDYLLGK